MQPILFTCIYVFTHVYFHKCLQKYSLHIFIHFIYLHIYLSNIGHILYICIDCAYILIYMHITYPHKETRILTPRYLAYMHALFIHKSMYLACLYKCIFHTYIYAYCMLVVHTCILHAYINASFSQTIPTMSGGFVKMIKAFICY